MPLAPGTTIGDYKILAPLGAGGMGQVYKVQNLISNRAEAMKILLPDLDSQADQVERFLREIQLQASLIHPNIASLYSAARIDKRVMMFMELVEGETLSSQLSHGPLAAAQAVNYTQQILGALAFAHEHGVIHRDIKPTNIMITVDGTAKLLDFGLAAGEGLKRLTRDGQILGSLYYMSPEQVRGEAPTRASDIYSMGLTLYEMLTGRRAVKGQTEFELITAQMHTMPEPPARVNPEVPEALSEIVLKAVAKMPGGRFGSAKEFRAALEQYQQLQAAPAAVAAASPVPTETMEVPAVAGPPAVGPAVAAVVPAAAVPAPAAQETAPVAARSKAPLFAAPLFAIGGAVAGLAALALGGVLVYRHSQAAKAQGTPVAAASPVAQAHEPLVAPNPQVTTEPAPAPPAESERAAPAPAPARKPAAEPATTVKQPAQPVTEAKAAPSSPAAATPAPAPQVPTTAPSVAVNTPQQQEADDWAHVRGSRDPAAIVGFLAKYPGGAFSAQATSRLADLEWEALSRGSTPAALRAFAARFPRSGHTPEALATAAHLELQTDVSAVLTRFEEAFAARDLKRVRTVWPGASKESISRVSDLFKKSRMVALMLQPEGDVRAGASQAEVVCRESLSFMDGSKPRQVDGTVVVRLVRAGDRWVIESLTTRGTASLYQPF